MTLGEVFDLSQDIELRHAKLYASLSLMLGDVDERVARFWQNMSAEEWQHYILIDFGRSLCSRAFGLDAPATGLPDASIKRIVQALNEHERRVKEKPLTLNEAFEIAIAIEGSEADTIYMDLLDTIKKAIYKGKQTYLLSRVVQIEKDVQAHVDRLIDATKSFSRDPDLVRKAHSLKDHHH